MRLLRVRRGFTTNSSGDNEYIPTPAPAPEDDEEEDDSDDGGQPDAAPSRGDAAPARTDAGPARTDAAPAPAVPVVAQDAGVPVVRASEPSEQQPAPAGAGSLGNTLALILVALAVAALFGAERILRFLRRRGGGGGRGRDSAAK